jgi:hypothetical protein
MAKEYQKTSKPKKPFNEGNKAKTNQKKKKTQKPMDLDPLFSRPKTSK